MPTPKVARNNVIPDGEAIKSLRHLKGWTADDLANKAGYSLRTIQKAEAGQGIFISTLSDIATALDVATSRLLLKQSEMKPNVTFTVDSEMFGDPEISNELTSLLERIAHKINASGVLMIVGFRRGSIRVDVRADNETLLGQIVTSFAYGDLHEFAVESITFHELVACEELRDLDDLSELYRRSRILRTWVQDDERVGRDRAWRLDILQSAGYHTAYLIADCYLAGKISVQFDRPSVCTCYRLGVLSLRDTAAFSR